MSKLMWVLGLVLAIVGVALGAKSIISPGQMQIYGLTPETAAILLVGGILSIGLAGLYGKAPSAESNYVKPLASSKEKSSPVKTVGEMQEAESTIRPANFSRRSTDKIEGLGAAVTEVKAAATPVVTGSVADTIAALEQAKSDIKTALGGVESLTEAPVSALPPETPAVAEVEDVVAEGELYVVEEKIIRGRPSRILSDDTVEAETDEGWMRFENLEHLNEYLDSMESSEA
jgi:hypothetical protein